MPDLEWYNHEQQLFHNERFNPLQNMTCKHIWSTLFQNLVSWLHRQNCKALQACFWSKGALIMLKCLFWKHENQIAEKENALQWNADCKNNSSETCKYFSDRFIIHQTLTLSIKLNTLSVKSQSESELWSTDLLPDLQIGYSKLAMM